jgi:hypothetical protein
MFVLHQICIYPVPHLNKNLDADQSNVVATVSINKNYVRLEKEILKSDVELFICCLEGMNSVIYIENPLLKSNSWIVNLLSSRNNLPASRSSWKQIDFLGSQFLEEKHWRFCE